MNTMCEPRSARHLIREPEAATRAGFGFRACASPVPKLDLVFRVRETLARRYWR